MLCLGLFHFSLPPVIVHHPPPTLKVYVDRFPPFWIFDNIPLELLLCLNYMLYSLLILDVDESDVASSSKSTPEIQNPPADCSATGQVV